ARPSLLAFGLATGALAIGLPTAILVSGHWLRNVGGAAGSWWAAAVRVTLLLIPAALVEELISRGYLLSVLREWWGWGWAIWATGGSWGPEGGVPAGLGMLGGTIYLFRRRRRDSRRDTDHLLRKEM